MSRFFDVDKIKTHDFPSNFIPADAEIFTGIDLSDGNEICVNGFLLDGIYYVQEVTEIRSVNDE